MAKTKASANKERFTSGPWRTWSEASAIYIEAPTMISKAAVEGTRTIARIDRAGFARGEAEANATLAAKAPELLAALERVLEVCRKVVPDHVATDPDHEYGKAEDEAHDVIRKARQS